MGDIIGIRNFGYCCTHCHIYWTCETKWSRGERHEEDICCSSCNYYIECQKNQKKEKTKPLKKKRNMP